MACTLALIAFLRLTLFIGAIPFFNNVDEQAHYDLVVKYSHGQWPRLDRIRFTREASEAVVLFGSPEFLAAPANPESDGVPPWKKTVALSVPELARQIGTWMSLSNYESFSSPLYYVAAGAWYVVGKWTGLRDLPLLVWVRFLNVVFYLALMAVAWQFLGWTHPNDPELRLSVLAVLAFFPQSLFYGITNDALTPLVAALALFGLTRTADRTPACAAAAAVGLAVAACLLTKLTAIAILGTLAPALLFAWRQDRRITPLLCLVGAAGLPFAAWLLWNQFTLGNLTGGAQKLAWLNWGPQPLGTIFHHPIFTASGAVYFLRELLKNFWTGELLWHHDRPIPAWADCAFLIITAVLAPFVAVLQKNAWATQPADQKILAQRLHAVFLVGSVATLAVLSTLFDFRDCVNPSRAHPYFVSGRLISGALLSFVVLGVEAVSGISRRLWRKSILFPLTLGFGVLSFAVELQAYRPIFRSLFNLYHYL